jgi:hypothetical protein
MARAALGIDLDVLVHIPHPGLAIPAAQQQDAAVAAEGGLAGGGLQEPEEGAGVS